MTIPLDVHDAEGDLDNIAFGGACIPNSSLGNDYIPSNALDVSLVRGNPLGKDDNSYKIR